jgi:ATP-dependent Clp protease protease subunit
MAIKDFNIDILYDDEELKDLSKVVLPDPDLLEYYSNISKRIIFWNTEIDEALVSMGMQILKWNKEDKNKQESEKVPIKIFINSNGGCVNSVMNFINIVKLSKTPVYTIAMGKAFSSGALLLMSGHKRFIFENTEALVHDGSTGAFGDTSKVMDSLERTKKLEDRVKKYILANTKITPKLYEKNYRKDWWLFSDEIIDLGIADKIITDLDEII